jgi:hypothetical protein
MSNFPKLGNLGTMLRISASPKQVLMMIDDLVGILIATLIEGLWHPYFNEPSLFICAVTPPAPWEEQYTPVVAATRFASEISDNLE